MVNTGQEMIEDMSLTEHGRFTLTMESLFSGKELEQFADALSVNDTAGEEFV